MEAISIGRLPYNLIIWRIWYNVPRHDLPEYKVIRSKLKIKFLHDFPKYGLVRLAFSSSFLTRLVHFQIFSTISIEMKEFRLLPTEIFSLFIYIYSNKRHVYRCVAYFCEGFWFPARILHSKVRDLKSHSSQCPYLNSLKFFVS